MSNLRAWLESFGLGKYAAVFAEQEVDFEVLPELNDQHLQELGIPLGHRIKLLKAIADLSAEDAAGRVIPSDDPNTPAPTPMSGAERRQLTVMFCDLVGSTALSERLDPEDLSMVIRTYQDCCRRMIDRFAGYIARYLGDGLVVYFGYPQATEHDPERAVRAGLEIVAAVGRLNLPLGLRLQTRIGIATGEVVVGDLIGEGAAQQRAVVGETPNLAARLQSLAEPNTVVVADSTQRLVSGLFE